MTQETSQQIQQNAKKLMEKRAKIEGEISTYQQILDTVSILQ
jgi:hypothetical protein